MYSGILGYEVKDAHPGTDHAGEIIVVTLQLHKEHWTIRGVPDQIYELLTSAAGHIQQRFLSREDAG